MRISILHWMQVETVTKVEEKAGALNAFFVSVFKSKTNSLENSILYITSLHSIFQPDLENRV